MTGGQSGPKLVTLGKGGTLKIQSMSTTVILYIFCWSIYTTEYSNGIEFTN